MADTLHEGQLAEAFTRFRSEVREEIRPPGTQAARHAARRRRRTIRVAGAAVTVALVGASVAFVTTVHSPDRTPRVYSTLSVAEMEELATQALRVLPSGMGITTAVTAQTQGEKLSIDHLGSSPLQFVQGEPYDLVALCRGRGRVTVAWEAPGGVTGHTQVVCGGDIARVRFSPRADGPIVQIRLTPDAEATGRAGIAIAIIEFQ